jgi:hypothetical protein
VCLSYTLPVCLTCLLRFSLYLSIYLSIYLCVCVLGPQLLNDRAANHRPVRALRQGVWTTVRWRDVVVGDILRMNDGEEACADVLLVRTPHPRHQHTHAHRVRQRGRVRDVLTHIYTEIHICTQSHIHKYIHAYTHRHRFRQARSTS